MNDELLNNFFLSSNYSKNTEKGYIVCLNQYCKYFDMSLQELLMEAEEEENKGVKWKYSKLKAKLLQYRQYLLDTYAIGSVKTKMVRIIKFYRFYDIDVQNLPKINEKSVKKPVPIYFKDLPDKEVIREAIAISDTRMTAITLFICSSGCARAETLSLTIQDYMDALSEYIPHRKMNIFEIIDYINDNENIVPTFNIRRIKTNKYYTTYCSPEAVKAINAYLISRSDPITPESPLFKCGNTYFSESFNKINDELGLGRKGNYRRFRSHMLRKFHASALYNDGMSLDKVNDLQGKSKNITDQSYFMTNPDDLKYEYISHLPAVTINKDVEKLSIKSPEFMQMEKQNEDYKNQLDELRDDIATIKQLFTDRK